MTSNKIDLGYQISLTSLGILAILAKDTPKCLVTDVYVNTEKNGLW